MAITTIEFEKHLNGLLRDMERWKRCEWCGCEDGQKRIGPRSRLCDSCKGWRQKERIAIAWQANNPDLVTEKEGLCYAYWINFASLCRNEGQIRSWKGPVTPLDLEWKLQSVTERCLAKGVFGSTIQFEQFSDSQRRLLMYLFEQMSKAWLQNHRRTYAIDAMWKKASPTDQQKVNERMLSES